MAIKTAMLLNGAGAIAVLTFLGQLAGTEHNRNFYQFTDVIFYFAFGAAAIGFCAASTYLCNVTQQYIVNNDIQLNRPKSIFFWCLFWIPTLFGAISYLFFLLGVCEFVSAFGEGQWQEHT